MPHSSELEELLVTSDIGIETSAKIVKALGDLMDLSPRGIRKHLGLNKPIYARTSSYGHFGREPEADGGFSWEKLDLVAGLQAAIS